MNAASFMSALKETYRQWAAHKSARLAAALAYYTIFSLAPLLLVVIAIAGLVFGADAAHGQITAQLQGTLGHKAAQQIDVMVKAAGSHRSGVIATVIGLVTLLLGASGLVMQLQDALNTVWDVQPERSAGLLVMLRERLLSFGMILGLGFLLLVSLALSSALSAVNTYTSALVPAAALLLQALNFVFDLGVLALFFAMIFKYLPQAVIAWRDVWVGAALSAVLFVAGQYALTLYLGKMNATSPYGDAGSLIVVLLWVYYSAQLLLFGAEFTRVWSGGHRVAAANPRTFKGVVESPEPSSVGGGTIG